MTATHGDHQRGSTRTPWPGTRLDTASSNANRRAIPMSGSRWATTDPLSPPRPHAKDQRITGHATRSHPHPSPSQTGSRAASSPPRAGRNFFWGPEVWFYVGRELAVVVKAWGTLAFRRALKCPERTQFAGWQNTAARPERLRAR